MNLIRTSDTLLRQGEASAFLTERLDLVLHRLAKRWPGADLRVCLGNTVNLGHARNRICTAVMRLPRQAPITVIKKGRTAYCAINSVAKALEKILRRLSEKQERGRRRTTYLITKKRLTTTVLPKIEIDSAESA